MEFSLTDFIIGLTLMNAVPHFVLGTFQARMLSGFGYGDRANIAYGLLNFAISIVLYIYSYFTVRTAFRRPLFRGVGRTADLFCDWQVLV